MAKAFSSSLSPSWASAGAAFGRAGLLRLVVVVVVVCLLCWPSVATAEDAENGNDVPPRATFSDNVFDQIFDNAYNVKEVKELEDGATPKLPEALPPPPEMNIMELNSKNIDRVKQKYDEMVSAENHTKGLFKAALGTSISAGLLGFLGGGLATYSRIKENDRIAAMSASQQEWKKGMSRTETKSSKTKVAARAVGALVVVNFLAALSTGIAQHFMAKKAESLIQQVNRSIHAMNHINKLHRITKGLKEKKDIWEEFDYENEAAK